MTPPSASWFAGQHGETFPARVTVAGSLRQTLRYGENPHQTAAFYVSGTDARPGIATATQLQGKELSYNNLNDTDAAFRAGGRVRPARPSPSSSTPTPAASPRARTWSRPMAARWTAIRSAPSAASSPLNRTLDAATAEQIAELFAEVVIAPDADEGARAVPGAQEEPAACC